LQLKSKSPSTAFTRESEQRVILERNLPCSHIQH